LVAPRDRKATAHVRVHMPQPIARGERRNAVTAIGQAKAATVDRSAGAMTLRRLRLRKRLRQPAQSARVAHRVAMAEFRLSSRTLTNKKVEAYQRLSW
jgi:hypothetical protein